MSGESGPTPFEEHSLFRLRRVGTPTQASRSFHLRILDAPPWAGADPLDFPDFASASVSVEGGRVRVAHRRFLAEIDPFALAGALFSPARDAAGLDVTLRVAISALLPRQGGLPLHAAGIILDGTGVAFFGPSGAGKSTLAAASPFPVVSDELVAVSGTSPTLLGTGFWGTLGDDDRPWEPAPLRALVELGRGPAFRLERLAPGVAVRRVLGSVLVPPLPALWQEAVAVLGRLVAAVPVFRMEWTPASPPWTKLAEALAC